MVIIIYSDSAEKKKQF